VQALCALDLLILVGEEDVDQNIFLEQAYRGHDLTRLQGENRLARARHWVAAVHGLATTQGWPYRLVFTTIPQTGHVLGSDLLTVAEVFLEPV
jgi:hypothetical protein